MSPYSPPLLIAALLAAALGYRYRDVPSRRTTALAAVTVVFWWAFDPPSALVLLAVATYATYVARILVTRQSGASSRRWIRRVSVAAAIAAMVFVRYTPSVVERFVEFGLFDRPIDSWWQPLGVAVMTLQLIAHIVDVDRGEAAPAKWAETLLVVGFFPRSFAGPLVRSGGFVAQLNRSWDGSVPLGEVAQRVMSAVFKSYVLAETLLRYEVVTTGSNAEIGRIDAVLHLIAGPLRFFLDVSALTDLAIAVGLCCGIRLPENFKAPFKAHTVGGLFRGWHTTISGFFRDYVFANLAGPSASPAKTAFASIATMVCIGIWHHLTPGAVLWGIAMGLPIGVELARERARRTTRADRLAGAGAGAGRLRAIAARAAVLGYVALISPLYNGSTLATAGRAWSALGNGWTITAMYTPWLIGCLVVAYLAGSGVFARPARALQRTLDRMPAWSVGVCTAVVVTTAAGLAGAGIPSFLYQRM